MTNTLAYYSTEFIAVVKSFIAQAQGYLSKFFTKTVKTGKVVDVSKFFF